MRNILKLFLIFVVIAIVFGIKYNKNTQTINYDVVIYGSNLKANILANLLARNKKTVLLIDEDKCSGKCSFYDSGISYINSSLGDTKEKFLQYIKDNSTRPINNFIGLISDYFPEVESYIKEFDLNDYQPHISPGSDLPRTIFFNKTDTADSVQNIIFNRLIEINKNIDYVNNYYNTEIINIEKRSNLYHMTLKQSTAFQFINSKSIVLCKEISNNPNIVSKLDNLDGTFINEYPSDNTIDFNKSTFKDILSKLNIKILNSYTDTIAYMYNWQKGQHVDSLFLSSGSILINDKGERFINEMNTKKNLINAMLSQNNKEVYLVYDEEIKNKISYLSNSYDYNINNESKTINELALKLNLDNNNLHRTIYTYRDNINKTQDTEYNRPIDLELMKNNFNVLNMNNKYYAIKVSPAIKINPIHIPVNSKFELSQGNTTYEDFYCISMDNNRSENDDYTEDINFLKDYSLCRYIQDRILQL